MTLITKKIEHRKAVNYPTLTLPGGSLSDLAPFGLLKLTKWICAG